MTGRSLIQALGAVLLAGFLSSGTCHYRACSGDCSEHDHLDAATHGDRHDRIRAYRLDVRGLPPADVSRLLTRIHGPWLLPEERAETRLRAEFAGRVVAANRELLGLTRTADLAFDARVEGDDLLLESQVRDLAGPCRVTLRIETTGRLSALRVDRPGL